MRVYMKVSKRHAVRLWRVRRDSVWTFLPFFVLADWEAELLVWAGGKRIVKWRS